MAGSAHTSSNGMLLSTTVMAVGITLMHVLSLWSYEATSGAIFAGSTLVDEKMSIAEFTFGLCHALLSAR